MTTMTSLLKFAAGCVVGAVIVFLIAPHGVSLGGVYSQVSQSFPQGLYAGTKNQLSVSRTGAVTTTGNATVAGLTVTTTDTATSTNAVGCIQTTATSTATPIRLVIANSGATTTYRGTNAVGLVGWQYGTCP